MTTSRKLGNTQIAQEVDRAALLGTPGVITQQNTISVLPMADALVYWFNASPSQICFQSVDEGRGTWLFWNCAALASLRKPRHLQAGYQLALRRPADRPQP